MFRLLLWFVILYIVWKIVKIISRQREHSRNTNSSIPPYTDIDDAEFEDITNKPHPSEQSNSEKSN